MEGRPLTGHGHTHFGQLVRRTGRQLGTALFLTLGLVLVEGAAGIFANSLVLLTDAAHNLTDVLALGLSWHAVRLTALPSDSQNTYGRHRAGILVALVNSTTLVLISIGIFYEAYRRFTAPPEVRSGIMITVGLLAVIVNLVTALLVRRGSEQDLNLRSTFLHLMGDVASTVGAVVAGVLIYFTGANWLDPVISVLIGIMIIYNAGGILQETLEILLESTPRDVDMPTMVKDIMRVQGVQGVHDLHVWSLTRSLRTMSAHIVTDDIPISVGSRIQSEVSQLVARQYNIAHVTLQLECAGCEPDALYCDINGVVHREA